MDRYVIFHIDGGCGKNIVATSVVKSIKAADPEHKLVVVTAYPEVFIHNPNIYRVYKFGVISYFYDDYIANKDSIILRTEPYHTADLLYRRKPLAEIWCDLFNIPFWSVEFIEVKGRDLAMGKLKRRQVEELYHIKVKVI